MPEYQSLVDSAVKYAQEQAGTDQEKLDICMDKLAVNFGLEILKIVPGYVSTEVDARLSFDAAASQARAERIVSMYEAAGVERSRVLIKLASTWEGFETAKALEAQGIPCNLTLLFSFAQAVAAAEAGVTLISPFVGRILDWYKKAEGKPEGYPAAEDPGVLSVTRIFNYYKKHGYKTIVMGASFRSKEEITELAGCDRLTIAPKWLEKLDTETEDVPKKLDAASPQNDDEKVEIDEAKFRWMLNEDAMATEKLAEGIRNFSKDLVKLEAIIKEKMAN